MNRSVTSLVVAFGLCAVAHIARSQSSGTWNPALRQATVDAAALGAPGRAFMEYSLGDGIDYTATLGVGLLGGALRGSFQHAYRSRVFGLGYARTLGLEQLGQLGTAGVGIDVYSAYDASSDPIGGSRAVRLSLPVSLRWGSPSGLSLAPYVAPYTEFGRMTYASPGCADFCDIYLFGAQSTHASGLAGGLQLTAWHLGLTVGARDLLTQRYRSGEHQIIAGLRFTF
jgi:hypothetical protein